MKKLLFDLILIGLFSLSQAQNPKFDKKTDLSKSFKNRFKDYSAALLIDLKGGKILFEHNAYNKYEIASVTKMMSILLVVEEIKNGKLSLKDTLRTSTAASKIGGSQIYLREHEEMSVEDLLKSVIMKSANDATTVLAEKIGGEGKVPLFVNMMNSRAKQLEMENTIFYYPHGLPPSRKNRKNNKGANLSTCYDLVLLAQEMLKHPLILKYSSRWTDSVRQGKNRFDLRNTSRLIKDYPYFDGLKTGFYDKAGFCIVATAKKDEDRLVAVVLGSRSMKGRDKFINDLVTWGFSELEAERAPEPVVDKADAGTLK
ncbi:MAG: D-alanyl-D-alanine carboxypeptidase [Candidatus Delongbacteria bacterium]|nr:D-alanyl-D-alanine carboxypeptidase [Candidatus Delongbacteria bacterium]